MAIKLIANYSKRLGLPGYSSHQFSISVEAEIMSVDQVQNEASRLYNLLQRSVDEDIQKTGFVPPLGYGMEENGQNGNGATAPAKPSEPAAQSGPTGLTGWNCSEKQRDLILKLIDEHSLDKWEIENLAKERFAKPMKALNKLEASGLIDELLERHGGGRRGGNGKRKGTFAGRRAL